MVMDKRHSRSTGPKQILTRQPTEGRAKNGGIRLGEMEKDAIMAHGASGFLQERLIHASDGTPTVICQKCGNIAEHPHSTRFGVGAHSGSPWCRNCNTTECHTLMYPFASSVLVRELQGMNIAMRQEVTRIGRFGTG